ncbi:MAG: ABC transporter ATP-binding protein, partial [Bacillota bacterium]|nr:ABC transporter ATP-binding protein [Bacillota bacterium]
IAQALLNDPELLVVDEPTAGLDPEERIRFRNLLAELSGERTVVLSTHIVEDVAQSCREMAVLRDGRIAWRGEPGELRRLAAGRAWEVEWPAGRLLPDGWAAVSTVHLGERTRYRLVQLEPDATAPEGALPVEPGLEEAYLVLMETGRQSGGAAPDRPAAG